MTLQELIPAYAENKSEMDSYKKLVNRDNALIKELMQEQKITETEVDGWQAKITTKKSESFNEENLIEDFECLDHSEDDGHIYNENKKYFRTKLFNLLQKNKVIKTRKYIDFDALESVLYQLSDDEHNFYSDDDIGKFESAFSYLTDLIKKHKEVKETIELRVKKVKKEK